uniref:Secreted protein n=1 Tax=Rhipicephalus zambeziensis TaxID=60191 RepID=A0A224Y649_9ACAR
MCCPCSTCLLQTIRLCASPLQFSCTLGAGFSTLTCVRMCTHRESTRAHKVLDGFFVPLWLNHLAYGQNIRKEGEEKGSPPQFF